MEISGFLLPGLHLGTTTTVLAQPPIPPTPQRTVPDDADTSPLHARLVRGNDLPELPQVGGENLLDAPVQSTK